MSRWSTVAVALLALGGCQGSRVGEACTAGQEDCEGNGTALECRNGKFVAVPCRGPTGCQVSLNNTVTCDTSLSRPGDGCRQSEEELAMCDPQDATSILVCTGGNWVTFVCTDGATCTDDGDRLSCE